MELDIEGTFDLSESKLSADEFYHKLLEFIESQNVYFGGAFYELDENGNRIDDSIRFGIIDKE